MISKTTFNTSKLLHFKGLLVGVMLFSSLSSFAQVVEDLFPSRVTTKTTITILGTGFTENTSITTAGNTITLTDVKFVSANEMTVDVSRASTGETGDITANLIVGGVNTGVPINYVGPTFMNYGTTTSTSNQFRVTEVFTSWDKDGTGFWRSSQYNSNNNTWPDDKHDLLGYTVNGITYSTGVDDDKLIDNGVIIDAPQVFKAYATNGITGNPHSSNFLAMADKIDGVENGIALNDKVRATVYDVIIDGAKGQGLELGTGITNFNQDASIRFFSGNAQVGALTDTNPDLLITQIADPGEVDIYYYADIDGNVVGRPIRLFIHKNSQRLFNWYLDLYRMNTNVPYDAAYPAGTSFGGNEFRPYRMVAFKLQDFFIENDQQKPESYIGNINNINMMAGGTADISFIAYNKNAFDIKSPKIDDFPVSRNICELPSTIEVTFKTQASIEGDAPPANIEETLSYQWYRNFIPITGETSNSYTLPPNITEDDLITYKVRVQNKFGAVDLPVTLSQGGVPTYWNGPVAGWVFPDNYYNGPVKTKPNLKFAIDDADRNLIFNADYSEDTDLKGCDCIVLAGTEVVIRTDRTLKLYSTITVEEAYSVTQDGVTSNFPAGQLTLQDNASLIQTKEVAVNTNSGDIIVEREASDIKQYDYVYWSTPVQNGQLSSIPGATRHVYEWDVDAVNLEGLGNWKVPSGSTMVNGRGYIKRVNVPGAFTSSFEGVPNNGNYTILVEETPTSAANSPDSQNWNLIGNPYPSAISGDSFLASNTIIDGAVYLWTHITELSLGGTNPFYQDFGYNYNSSDYLVYNGTASTDPKFDGNIASGQGFFVKAVRAGLVRFTNAMRFENGAPNYDNSQFYRTEMDSKNSISSDSEKQLLWLALTNESKIATVAVVGYAKGATYGEDNLYDASHMGNNDFSLYTQIAENRLVIQGRPLPFDSEDQVVLGVAIPTNGIYSIAIDHLKGSIMLNKAQGIYLEDTYLDVIHDLRAAPYNFTTTAGDIKDRFVLRYMGRQLSVEENQLSDTFVYVKNNQLYVKGANPIETIVVYDVTGKQLINHKPDGYTGTLAMPFPYPRGVYLTVVTLENSGSITKKVIN